MCLSLLAVPGAKCKCFAAESLKMKKTFSISMLKEICEYLGKRNHRCSSEAERGFCTLVEKLKEVGQSCSCANVLR